MIFNYDRAAAIQYAKDWCKNGGSNLYPDLSTSFGNSFSFLYQCLYNGGFFWEGSAYLDTFGTNVYPVIAKMSSFIFAITDEIKAIAKSVEDTSLSSQLRTGDIVIVYKENGGSLGLIAEVEGTEVSFYATSPPIYGEPLPEGDKYLFCFIPDAGER